MSYREPPPEEKSWRFCASIFLNFVLSEAARLSHACCFRISPCRVMTPSQSKERTSMFRSEIMAFLRKHFFKLRALRSRKTIPCLLLQNFTMPSDDAVPIERENFNVLKWCSRSVHSLLKVARDLFSVKLMPYPI